MESVYFEFIETTPANFDNVKYEHQWQVNCDEDKMWKWLNCCETFSGGQIGPYTVEFLDSEFAGQPRFAEGVLTNHYGPFLNAAGIIQKIDEKSYRDLRYFYGSYVFFFSLVRPTRLQFFYDRNTRILSMQFDAQVRGWFRGIWLFGMNLFWPRFGKWMAKENPIAE